MWDHAGAARRPAHRKEWLVSSLQRGPGPQRGSRLRLLRHQAILFALILLLIPVGLFAFNWPVWLLVVLLFIDLILLFFVSMTSVFLLRVFFADRRRGRGRQTGVAKPQTRVINTEMNSDEE